MNEPIPVNRLDWAIEARTRSQKLLLALYAFGERHRYRSGESVAPSNNESVLFSFLVGVAFSLWRAAFLAEAPTRDWPGALQDAQGILETVLRTNTISFGTDQHRQGWTAGYYLNNAKLRLQEIRRRQVESGQASAEDVARVEGISLLGTDPHDTWKSFCAEAEHLARQLGCELPL